MIQEELRQALATHLPGDADLEIPPDPSLGDYAVPCFPFAKELRKAPQQIASDLAEHIPAEGLIARVEAAGPYLNIFLDRSAVAARVVEAPFEADRDGSVLFEFLSPNTNKPLHLGHVRNILLGSSCSEISQAAGMQVVRVNLNNDRGVAICKSMLAYQRWGEGATPEDMDMKPDHFVGHWYVEFAKRAEDDPALEDEAQQMLQRWEAGDDEVRALWERMRTWALSGHAQTLERMGIAFDKHYNESEIYDKGKQLVEQGLKDDLFERDEKGNIVCDLEEAGLGTKVLLRADGTTVYMTQDLYLAQLRQEEYAPDSQVYVVAEEQKHHFNQLFTILDRLGMPHADRLHHLAYGLIALPEGRMKSREGTVVDADDLLDEMESLAAAEIRKRHPDLEDDEVARRAVAIGHAALRFYMLKYEPKTGFTYNPEESISFEGETGPYVQYAAARITSMLSDERAAVAGDDAFDAVELSDEEWTLVTLMRDTMTVVQDAAKSYKPHLVARHALSLAQAFTTFYHEHRVLDAPETERKARIVLIKGVKEHIAFLLRLLGIETPEAM